MNEHKQNIIDLVNSGKIIMPTLQYCGSFKIATL